MRRIVLIVVPLLVFAASCGDDGESEPAPITGDPFSIVGPTVTIRPDEQEIDVRPAEGTTPTGLDGCDEDGDGVYTIGIAPDIDFGPEDASAIDNDPVDITGKVENCRPVAIILKLAQTGETAEPSPSPSGSPSPPPPPAY